MKKKYLSAISAVLSLTVALLFVVIAILFTVRVAGGKEYVPEITETFWLNDVIQRLKKAGFNVFFSIMGIILSVVLVIYRIALTYFYFKVFRGDEEFYKGRKSEIIFFSILAAIVATVACYIYINRNLIPTEFRTICLILFILYCLLFALPICELVIVGVVNASQASFNKEEKIPDKDDIINELDHLAEETAEKVVLEVVEEKRAVEEEEKDA